MQITIHTVESLVKIGLVLKKQQKSTNNHASQKA